MTKVPVAIEELHRSENELAAELLRVSDRHSADHEVHHVARDLARWSREHVRGLAAWAPTTASSSTRRPRPGATCWARCAARAARRSGRHHEPALLLLRDLRGLYLQASGVSVDWEILAQTAQALEDHELLDLTQASHPETLRQLRWANGVLKECAAQVMVTP